MDYEGHLLNVNKVFTIFFLGKYKSRTKVKEKSIKFRLIKVDVHKLSNL